MNWSVIGVLWMTLLGCLSPLASAEPTASPRFPTWSQVRDCVTKTLLGQSGYRDGDLLTRTDLENVLRQLERIRWRVANRQALLERAVDPDSFLAQQLSSASGKSFMRQVARNPQAYDRLDRLAGMPQGQQTIRDLIRSPRGFEMLEYMTTVRGGANLGRQLSRGVNGANFNSPTGRIYTAEQLLERLKPLHSAAAAKLGQSAGR